ncbi:MAG: ABC-F family ATP-binding cassette domain-containing protein [Victivallales bacterium]|nr:ABC-F family ATP-binding cassette domain-containing protein [Victivallales bacterium]
MPPAFLQFQSVSFTYASMTRPLLVDVKTQFPTGWTGVVGPNGAGKSTLLMLAVGDLKPQTGTIRHPGSAICCAQRTDLPPEELLDFVYAGDREAALLRNQLGVEDSWLDRWDTLSHGERKRAQIGVALWLDPNVLALDEPTNHIDDAARQLLIGALRRFQGVGLLVSHDRELLDALCGQCLFLDPPEATMRPGGVSHGLEQNAIEHDTVRREDDDAKRTIHRLQRETQRRREAAAQFAAKNQASKHKKPPAKDHDGSAKRNLAKLTGKDAFAGKLAGRMDNRARRAKETRASITVKKTYEMGIWLESNACSQRAHLFRLPAGDIPLGGDRRLHFPDLTMRPTDRIAITGPNGLGKSTLLRHILTDLELPPERLVHVPQEISAEESRRILAEVAALPKDRLGQIMTIVSRLGSRPQRLIESDEPSPGEIRKILLAMGIAGRPHLIVMDEPTNHMDLPSIGCLEEALGECPCGLLLVSHDRRFLQALATINWDLVARGDDSVVEVSLW